MDIQMANHALEKLAKQKGLPVESVIAEIESAIAQAAAGQSRELFRNIPCAGELPTAPEMIAYISEMAMGMRETGCALQETSEENHGDL